MFRILTLVTLLTVLITGNLFGQTYYLYVAAESEDEVALISFDANTEKGTVDKVVKVGEFPVEIEGPHGLRMGPDGDHWYMTMGHGIPFGHLYKYEVGTDRYVDRVELGMFPATLDYSPVTGWFYAVNFNLHGDHEPSTVSVVDPETMQEIEQIETGIMPHGARISPDGMYMYHVSMMTDELIVLNTVTLDIVKRLHLGKREMEHDMGHGETMQHDEGAMDHDMHDPVVSPTWVDPHPDKPLIYVAGNGSDQIFEINIDTWETTRVFETEPGPYNLEVTPDGSKLVVTYKSAHKTGIWDLERGEELKVLENSRRVTHGVVVSPDNRFAFVSVEGVGGEPGSVDIIDLENLRIADVVEIGKQGSGIAFWKMEE